ncbi:hypothetical protein F5Y14DRAFT_455716 [Nemania sp. NC0429]|nr:hypothetical protein F5Y14DRAFT_455716 [Nemania sp. NC0429]
MAPALEPTRTLAQSLTRILASRQQTTTVIADDSGTQGTVLSGGAIAGIVIGSIAGFLLLLWVIRSCMNMGRPETWGNNTYEPEREKRRASSGTYHVETTTPYRHHHDRHHHRSHSHHHHSRSPRRVAVVPLEPRTPPAAYYGGRSSYDERRRSGDARGYRY